MVIADLQRRVAALQTEIVARQAELEEKRTAVQELRTALEKASPRGWRSWRWVGQLPALLTALAAVGALFYTAQGLAQSQSATSRQNDLTVQQNQLAQSGQITDRFSAAVTNLGSEVLTIRLGGIYALQRIMTDSPPDQSSVVQVLAAFVRSQSSAGPPVPPASQRPAMDVQAALTVLVTRNLSQDGPGWGVPPHRPIVDLAGAHLAGAFLVGANLTNASLIDADLTDAELYGANFTNADLTDAKLTAEKLAGANLYNANMYGTVLCDDLRHTEPEFGAYRCGFLDIPF